MVIQKIQKVLFENYDPLKIEIQTISKITNLRGKNILIIGTAGVLSLSFKIRRFCKSVTAIHTNQKIIEFCKTKAKDINFILGDISNLPFDNDSFDLVVSCLGSLHTNSNKTGIMREIKRVLKERGIFIVEETNEKSDFSNLIDNFAPIDYVKIKEKKEELKKIMEKVFELSISGFGTFYSFKNFNDFKETVGIEVNGRGKKLDANTEKKFNELAKNYDFKKINESMVMFIGRKLNSKN